MNITKPTMDSRTIDLTDRLTAIETLDACPVGTTAELTDGSAYQAVNTKPGVLPPLWSGYAGPGCVGRILTAGQVVARAQRLEKVTIR
ncbi:hypothetical protein PACID_15650 [Acidipropionibacterium acidipropionici ATCC 4875]|uniref:Uncharacterized protein n=1 Tax=Acidipropionibacterium acidipropionici (strain ATCC 4875 / DSM 20272 / JCM 6432 / NBRC 12425 / NCIMB 8070 / 4) TaxID=1171373 RepID=K7RWR0_ACIA4|nr:hypothetical protein [Acidipropionibacterium acidipropionici]AFV89378.1 hypothetical protein PACID_15650 [Acidipropionibacterium acidipropionici ATCC 4875]